MEFDCEPEIKGLDEHLDEQDDVASKDIIAIEITSKPLNEKYDHIFYLTRQQASLSNLLSGYPSFEDNIKYSNVEFLEKCSLLISLNVPKEIVSIVHAYLLENIPRINEINNKCFNLIADYLRYHNGIEPNEIAKPLNSFVMKNNVDDPWDAQFIDNLSQ